jgi:hypothetical protein
MTELDRRARIAGGLYMATFIPGLFSLIYVPSRFIVGGNPAATIANILADETLFRWGIFGEVAGAALWIVVIVALYRLFVDVDRFWAWMMAGLGAMCAPIMLLNVLSEMAMLGVLNDPGFAAAFTPAQLQKLVQALLRSHGQGFDLLVVFSGLWLFPLAVLVWRSGFLPKALAVLQVIGGLAYMASSCTALLSPPLYRLVDPVASLVSMLGETPAMLWLLLMGAKARAPAGAVGAAGSAPAGA